MQDPGVVEALARHFGWAWVGLCAAVAAHVADEALTGFLSVYNPIIRRIRGRLPWLPLPTFTFRGWLSGLALAVAVALSLSPLAFRGAGWMVGIAFPLGVLLLGNGLVHLAGSVALRRWLPGVFTAPLLLIASAELLVAAWRLSRAGSG